VPAYNNEAYIAETIESILDQTYQDFELIIADHSSADDTWSIVQRWADDPRVTLLTTEAGGGAKRNWDRVSKAARGEYLKLVCADDLVEPDIVERQVAALDAEPAATLAASARRLIDATGRTVIANRGLGGFQGRVKGTEAIRKMVVEGSNILGEPACVMMRRATLEKVGWWDDRFPYLIDQTTYAQVLREGDLVAVPGALAAFRMSDTQWSVRLVSEQSAQARRFHEWAKSLGIVTGFERLRGDLAARMTALLRRGAYLVFSARMRRETA
jgi:glycosyltransferase involved in cell wall biosynthesis